MNYLSLFSGIEAASVAWHDFGWTCVGFSEIDPFPSAVLKHHYPNVPNLGDITKLTKEKLDDIKEKHGTIDIVVGGSPCQSFSVAGKRLGLEDPRGNLMFEYCRVVRTVRPKYFIWENVPGALSSGNGRDFGAIIGEMADIGYSLCWRVLDAQYFGVPQRRRRVFLVGCLGKNTSAFEILFECKGSRRDLIKSTEEGQRDSTQVESRTGEHVEKELDIYRKSRRAQSSSDFETWIPADVTNTLNCFDVGDTRTTMAIVEQMKSVTFLESAQPYATMGETSTCSTLTPAMGIGGGHVPMIVDTDCFTQNTREEVRLIGGDGKTTGCLSANSGSHQTNYLAEYYYYNQTNGTCTGPDPIAGTLLARYGTGGGNVPFVMEHHSYNVTFNDANGTRKDRPNGGCYINETDVSNAITCGGVGDTKIVECIPLDLRNATRDADRESRTGLGIGKEGSPANTLTGGAVPGVFYVEQTPCDLYNTAVDQSGTMAALTTQSNATGSGPRSIETTICDVYNQSVSSDGIAYTVSTATGSSHGSGPKLIETIEEPAPVARVESRVRRLTPLECERLQGFPDNWTKIPYNKKSAEDCPESPRYKALGNSMAVPVMKFIGLGIAELEKVI